MNNTSRVRWSYCWPDLAYSVEAISVFAEFDKRKLADNQFLAAAKHVLGSVNSTVVSLNWQKISAEEQHRNESK